MEWMRKEWERGKRKEKETHPEFSLVPGSQGKQRPEEEGLEQACSQTEGCRAEPSRAEGEEHPLLLTFAGTQHGQGFCFPGNKVLGDQVEKGGDGSQCLAHAGPFYCHILF